MNTQKRIFEIVFNPYIDLLVQKIKYQETGYCFSNEKFVV